MLGSTICSVSTGRLSALPFHDHCASWGCFFFSQIHLCRKKVASRSCRFYNNVEGKRGSVEATPAGWSAYSQVGLEHVLPLRPRGLLALPFGAPEWPHRFS